MKKKLWIILTMFLYTGFVAAEPTKLIKSYTYKRYSIPEGLPQMQLTHIIQDHKGFLWISHWNGISRFDGVSFDTFSKNNGLFNHAAYKAIEFKPDSLALINPWGLSFGNQKGFTSVKLPDNVIAGRFSEIYFSNGNFYVFNLLKNNTQEYIHFQYLPSQKAFVERKEFSSSFIHHFDCNSIRKIFISDSCYWIEKKDHLTKQKWKNTYFDFAVSTTGECFGCKTKDESLWKINLSNDSCMEEETAFVLNEVSRKKEFNVFHIYGSKVVYYNSQNEMFIATPGKTEPVGRKFNVIRNFLTDSENNFWVASEEGLYNFFKFNFQKIRLFPDRFSDMVWSIAQTQKGEMLFGAYSLGIFRERNSRIQKTDVKNLIRNAPDLDADRVYMGASRNRFGDVYIPLRNGLFRIDQNNRESVLSVNGTPQMIIANKQGDTLFAAKRKGMLYIYPDGKIQQFGEESGFGAYQNEAIARDKNGHFWLSSSQRDFIQVFDGKKVTHWLGEKAKNTTALASDYKGNIWMGTHNGLFLYDFEKEIHFSPEIINCPVYTIAPYSDSLLVLGTPQKLFVVNIKEYYRNNSLKIYPFGLNNGYTSEGCIQNSYCIDNNGFMWFMGVDNCYRFNPLQIQYVTPVQKPNIFGFEHSKNRVEWQSNDVNNSTDKIELPKNHNHIRFHFASVSFDLKDFLVYRFRLTNDKPGWLNATKFSFAEFTNLHPGEYRLEVQASADGVKWSPSSFSPVVKIPVIWLKSPWLHFLFTLLFSTLVFVLSRRYYTNQKKNAIKRLKTEQEITTIQLNNIKSYLNPHFIFNALNSIGSEIISGEPARAYTYHAKLSGLIRESMIASDTTTKSLKDELQFVHEYLEIQKYRFGPNLNFNIKTEDDADLDMQIPKMCIQLLVENSFKHGIEPSLTTAQIDIRVSKSNGYVVISVADNGKGFSPKKENKGTGHKSLNQIFEIYNKHNLQKATIECKNQLPGAVVNIYIPEYYSFNLNNAYGKKI